MNNISALRAVVFPLAVPPQNRIDAPSSIAIQKYAAISEDIDLYSIKSTGVRGISLNLRIVNVEPFVTVLARVAWRRDPSGNFPSTMGENIDICLPET